MSLLSLALAACASPEAQTDTARVLRLATTTSTEDSGLLSTILPDFEAKYGARLDVVAVGTGQALALAVNGDADVVLVHARAKEDQFIADGHGLYRLEVMYNDFVIVGPAEDSAGVAGAASAVEAFGRIARSSAPFISRGDESGTHAKEMALWDAAGARPSQEFNWYFSIGQGMGETLQFTHEKLAYTLTDRGTWLAQRDRLPDLVLLFGGEDIAHNPDDVLLNPYGVIPVNPQAHPDVNAELAVQFCEWITSIHAQELIASFGIGEYGQPLFYPNSDAWREIRP